MHQNNNTGQYTGDLNRIR